MIIDTAPQPPKTMHDFDFLYVNGFSLPITLDFEAGDLLSESDEKIIVWHCPKPSKINAETILPAEETVIFKKNLMLYQHRTREFIETPDMKATWLEAFKELSTNSGKTTIQ